MDNENKYETAIQQYEAVKYFSTVGGQYMPTEQIRIEDLTLGIFNLRNRLIFEELVEEYTLASSSDNLIEIFDAIVDSMYVIYGALGTLGVQSEELKNIQLYQKDPNKKSTLLDAYEQSKINRNISLYKTELERVMIDSSKTVVIDVYKNKLINLLKYMQVLAEMHNLDVINGFKVVQDSNMSKFCKTEEEALQDLASKNNNPKYKDASVKYNEFSGLYVIYRVGDNKILKGSSFKEPNLKPLL